MTTLLRDPGCTLCKLHQTAQFVCLMPPGPAPCEVMIIGEAPGAREDDSGEPFVGKSGHLLDHFLEQAGLDRSEIFITNAVLCRPPNNKTPTKAQIRSCNSWLNYQIKKVKPKYVMLLGNVPLQSITGKPGIKKRRGKPFKQDGIIFLPTYHPAYALRDESQRPVVEGDFRSFASIIEFGDIPYEKDLSTVIVNDRETFEQMLEDLEGTVSYDIETNGLYPWSFGAEILSIAFGTRKHQYVVPLAHSESAWKPEEYDELIDRIDEKVKDCFLVVHNGKFDSLWTKVHFGVEWKGDFDTMLAHYTLDENTYHGLKGLAQRLLGAPDWEIDLDEKQGKGPLGKLAVYQAHDVFYTRKLYYHFMGMFKKDPDVYRVFKHIMMPCARLFVDIEYRGVYVNVPQMGVVEEELKKRVKEAKEVLSKYGDINWGSPAQVRQLFFSDLKIKPLDKTDSGLYSTSESVLKRLNHPAAKSLLDMRAADKQLNGFIDGWKGFIVKNRLHPSFKLHGTVTGRLSCENPNLQQVPRDPLIRSLICAPEGWELIEADLSQIELRIAAELSGDKEMLHAFLNGIDIHWLTALKELARGAGLPDLILDTAKTLVQRKVNYGEAIDILLKAGPDACAEVNPEWKEVRKKAKAINFGYVFGMWWKKFLIYARDNYNVVLTEEQAQASREAFFDTYTALDPWQRRQKGVARRQGYVVSLTGRKRRLPAAMSREDTPERAEAQRQAINSPVQSFANDINLASLIQLSQEFPRNIYCPVGTVHDAILAEAKREHVERIARRTLKVMSWPSILDIFEIELSVPIEAEVKIGPWSKGVSIEKWLKANRK